MVVSVSVSVSDGCVHIRSTSSLSPNDVSGLAFRSLTTTTSFFLPSFLPSVRFQVAAGVVAEVVVVVAPVTVVAAAAAVAAAAVVVAVASVTTAGLPVTLSRLRQCGKTRLGSTTS